ncbi:MAG: beta strand repeat-containing protein [Actinomycetota bacterium]
MTDVRSTKRFVIAVLVAGVYGATLLAQPAHASGPNPTVQATQPSSGANNATVSVTLTGTGFQTGATVALTPHSASFPAQSVAGTITSPITPAAMTASFNLASTSLNNWPASPGSWDITVTNPDTSAGGCQQCFSVTSAAPTVTALSPTGLIAGSTQANVTLTGTNFAPGMTATFSGTGISVNSTTFVSATQATVNITIANGAAVGSRTITVQNTDTQTGTCACFNVLQGPIPNAALPAQASNTGTVNLTINGSGFAPGDLVSLQLAGQQDITGLNVNVAGNGASMTATFDLTSAAPAKWDIRVWTPDATISNVCAGCFTVTSSTPTVSSVLSAGQGAQSFALTIAGTNFAHGSVASFSGTGITVNSTAFTDSSHVTATITVSPTATTGARDITITNTDSQSGTCTGCLTIDAAPTIASPSPSARGQGAAPQDIALSGTGLVQGATTAFGAGVHVVSTTVTDATHATVNVSVDPTAVAGTRDITFTNPDGGVATCAGCFTVTSAPSGLAASPSVLGQGATSQTVTINGANFVTGAGVVFSGTGIVVNSDSFVSATQLTVNVTVASDAPVAQSNITVTNPDGGVGNCTNCFGIALAPGATSAAPASLGQGATSQAVTITGAGFASGATVSFSGTGITVNSTSVTNATTAVANITIGGTAPTGSRDITIVNPNAGTTKCVGCFTVNPAPTATSASPSSRGQGATSQDITIIGTNFLNGATVSFAGSGITVRSTRFVDSAHLVATIDVASGATAAPSNITVQNPDFSTLATCSNCFTVNPAPGFGPNNVPAASPASRGAGATSQTITVTGVNFASGLTAAVVGGGVTVNSTSFTDTAHFNMVISVDPNAIPGARDIRVTNADGGTATCTSCFTVNAAPTATSASPSPRGQGAASQVITVVGSNFVSGAVAAFSGAGITVNSTTFTDSTHLSVNISIASSAPVSARDVTITNPDAGAITCSACFTVSPGPVVSSVSPSSRGQGATNQNVSIIGSNFLNGASVSFGSGVVVNTLTFVDGSHLTANISITGGPGTHDVTVTNTPDQGVGVCTACFAINTAPTATSASPNIRGQGATSQTISIVGTGFSSGATAAFVGGGITVSSTSFVDSSHLNATISIDPAAATTARDIVVTNPDGGVGTCTGCFTVSAAPGVSSSTPNAVSNSSPVTVTITGSGFVSGATASLQQSGQSDIPGTSIVFNSATSLKATFDVTGASPAVWALRVTNPDGGSSVCAGCFTIGGAAPTLSSASPANGGQGATENVTLAGSNFAKGAGVAISGNGITINSTSFVDTTHLSISITISPTADATSRDITVTNTDGQTGAKTGVFTVDLGPTATSASPASRGQGATSQVIAVSGSNFASGMIASFGSGITVSSVGIVSGTLANITITVSNTATPGSRDITLTNADGGSVTCGSCFTVNAAPNLGSATPSALGQHATSQSITLVGSGFESGAIASFSGSGVTINSSSFVDATHLSLNVSIDPGAATGTRDISLTNPDGATTAVCAACFTVDAAPTVSLVNPSSRGPGATSQSLTISGTGFTSGSVVSFSGSGVSVDSTQMSDAQHLVAVVSVSSSAASGARDITIGNPDAGFVVCSACFTVNPPPAVSFIAPSSLGQGAVSQAVTLTGTGFMPGTSASLSGTGATLNSVTYIDATHLDATISVSSSAPTGSRDITITNPDGGSPVVCSGCFVVNAAPTLSSVGPNAMGAGATTQNVTLNETGLESGATLSFGDGITVNSVSVIDATHGSANITVSSSAVPGSRNVTITNPDGGTPATCSACFTVLQAGLKGTLTLNATPYFAPYGTTRTISGTLVCNGSPVAFDSLRLLVNGASRTVSTNASGVWSVTDKPSYNTTYAATWAGNSACLGGASSSQAPVKVGVWVPVSYSHSWVPVGSKVYIWGSVFPAKPGKIVKLQVFNGPRGVWFDVTSLTLSGANYSFNYRLTSSGYRLFRVVYPTQDSLNQWGVSKSVKVTWG